jgi:hypothetical protein
MSTAAADVLMSSLAANGRLWLTRETAGAMEDIGRRIRDGDESGWRGDPSMALFYNQNTGNFEVWGYDRTGKEYLACVHPHLTLEIITKLREGDWQKHDVIQRVLDQNARMQADRDRADREKRAEIGDKLQWGIRQDFGAHLGGRKRFHAVTDEHRVKEAAGAACA